MTTVHENLWNAHVNLVWDVLLIGYKQVIKCILSPGVISYGHISYIWVNSLLNVGIDLF